MARNNHNQQELRTKVWQAADVMRAKGLHIIDYMEQLSLFMFLKMMHEREQSEREQVEVFGGDFQPLFQQRYRWSEWTKLSGKKLRDFMIHELFPYLQDQPGIVGKVFRETNLKLEDASALKAVLGILDEVRLAEYGFDALGTMYEFLLSKLAEAGAAGEYFTYRHIIDLMIHTVEPQFGETVYDPAAGTCGFLWRSLEYIKDERGGGHQFSEGEWEFLRDKAFWGHEQNRLTYRMGLLNMFLHGIDTPNLERLDTLAPGTHVGRKYDVILSNPPYGGKVIRESLRSDFFEPSTKTQLLFLQHIMMSLDKGGRAAMISDEGLYFQGGAFARVREKLLKEFNVKAVISLPPGTFEPYTPVKTSVVFFWNDGNPTQEVWFYDLESDGSSLSKARKFNPGSLLAEDAVQEPYRNDIPDLLARWLEREESKQSWRVPIEEIAKADWNLTASRYNPHPPEELEHKSPEELAREILATEQMIREEVEALLEVLTEEDTRPQELGGVSK